MTPYQYQKTPRRPFDDLVDSCAAAIVQRALDLSGCQPMDRQLGPMLGMADSGIHNRQAVRMWIRGRLIERRMPIPKSESELETLHDQLWMRLLPMLLQMRFVIDVEAEEKNITEGSGCEPATSYRVSSPELTGEAA